MTDKELAMFLATRQKRLEYWQKAFREDPKDKEEAKDIAASMNTYSLAIAKLARPSSDKEREETTKLLLATEQRLNGMFEQRRLATSASTPKHIGSTPVMKPR